MTEGKEFFPTHEPKSLSEIVSSIHHRQIKLPIKVETPSELAPEAVNSALDRDEVHAMSFDPAELFSAESRDK